MLRSTLRRAMALLTALTLTAAAVSPAAAQAVRPPSSAETTQGAPAAEPGAPVADPGRANTGGAQTLEDILARQRGETVAPEAAEVGPANLPDGTPGDLAAQGGASDAALWRAVRQGSEFSSSLPDPRAAQLVRDGGGEWAELRNETLPQWSLWAIGGVAAALALFLLVFGRMKVHAGMSGVMIQRFTFIERFGHWVLGVSFVVLAITGFALLAGRAVMDWLNGGDDEAAMGAETYAAMVLWGKWLHNNLSWAFMLALVLVFVMWVTKNIPTWTDVKWLARGGGLIGKGHPPAKKFNAGQKIIFWVVILLGASISASGLMLLFPYELPMFAETFSKANAVGGAVGYDPNLNTELGPVQEQQYAQVWHTIIAIVFTAIILAHIYLGSVGMQGAFSAMGKGKVDANWAREHHNLWVAQLEREGKLTPEQIAAIRAHPDGDPALDGRGRPHPAATPAE